MFASLNNPVVKTANGVYYNKCCGLVVLDGNYMKTNTQIIEIHQVVMKFGLTVYPRTDPRFFKKGKSILSQNNISSLVFDSVKSPHYFDTTDEHMNIYRFQRLH